MLQEPERLMSTLFRAHDCDLHMLARAIPSYHAFLSLARH